MEAVTKAVRTRPTSWLLAGALLIGFVYGVLQEANEMSAAFWWIFVTSAIILGAAGVAFSDSGSAGMRSALRAVPVLMAALLGLALGDFAAYALGIEGRVLEEYSLSMSWQKSLVVTVALAVLYGALLGLVAAFVAYVFRQAVVRQSGV